MSEPHDERSTDLGDRTQQIGLLDEAAFEASLVDSSVDAGSAIDPLIHDATPADIARQPAWAGKQLGHFRLLRLIGRGSMGLVIQARDVNLHRIVALKVLRKRIGGMDERHRVEQFLREARAAAQIEHPNIVRVYEINEHDGWWYIAMEMVEGETLRDVVKAVGRLSPERACPIIADAATALAVAHEAGIIHRDVKPNNIMITRTGRGKLADFGLVRVSDPDDPFDFTDKSVGTPQYMAPEVIQGQRATPAVDVYGLGGSLFFALTGRPPYAAQSIAKLLKMHCDAPTPDLRQTLAACPDSLADLIARTMAKDPNQRPTAALFAAALRAETITLRADDSAAFSAVGSSWLGAAADADAAAPRAAARPPSRLIRLALLAVIAIAPLAATIALIVLALLPADAPPHTHVTPADEVGRYLASTFAQAPRTYGLRERGDVPRAAPPDPAEAPPFGWVGRVHLPDAAYVASSSGRHYWPVDHPDARFIRHDLVVGYANEQDARSDRKRPAP